MKTAKQRTADLKRLSEMTDADIDFSDIPEQTDWSGAEVGKFYRPVKKQITLRIDADVLAWFKAKGGKYQTDVNRVLRDHMARERSARWRKSE
ncbi:MAG: BrnA antitoxin family protein [Hyphomicrobiaceae bacterium]|nr:BrnA antitoxin family protein [Hyphomicrobiaceae bacterium]